VSSQPQSRSAAPLSATTSLLYAVHISGEHITVGAAAWHKVIAEPEGFAVAPLRCRDWPTSCRRCGAGGSQSGGGDATPDRRRSASAAESSPACPSPPQRSGGGAATATSPHPSTTPPSTACARPCRSSHRAAPYAACSRTLAAPPIADADSEQARSDAEPPTAADEAAAPTAFATAGQPNVHARAHRSRRTGCPRGLLLPP
jgi:hypothetical protein